MNTKQAIISDDNPVIFGTMMVRLMSDGWKIVPGTIVISAGNVPGSWWCFAVVEKEK